MNKGSIISGGDEKVCHTEKTVGSRLDSAFEDFLREVALGGIRNQGHNALSWPKTFGDLDRRVDIGARTRSTANSFAGRELLDRVKSLNIGYFEDLVADRAVEIAGNKTVPDAFDFVRPGRPT